MDVRPSSIAGAWYPASPTALAESIDTQLNAVELPPHEGEIVGVIAPHAGHRYSGQVAAYAFRCLASIQPQVVAVVSPLHYTYPGRVLTTGHSDYATPLGEIPIDKDLIDKFGSTLAARGGPELERVRNDQEHSLEIELPFLQRAIQAPFRLLPIMLKDQTRSTSESVGHALAEVIAGESAVMVASSDLSHFYPDSVARQLDRAMLSHIEAFDPVGVLAAEELGEAFACGKGALASVLWAAKDLGADRVKLLKYATSGDVTGDQASVVGYASAAIYRTGNG